MVKPEHWPAPRGRSCSHRQVLDLFPPNYSPLAANSIGMSKKELGSAIPVAARRASNSVRELGKSPRMVPSASGRYERCHVIEIQRVDLDPITDVGETPCVLTP
jgi:hypothetical protein